MLNSNAISVAKGKPGSSTLLIVEDEAIVALDLQMQLQAMGYTVCGTADNGSEAISNAWKYRPDVILMDIMLKGDMDGVEAAQHIRHGLHIPVIFLTAYSDTSTVARASRVGPYGYLTKPFRAEELRAAIEVALYKATLERQLQDSERWFASTLRSAADGIVITDDDGKVEFMNPSAETLLGWQLGDALGRAIAEIAPIEERKTGAATESSAMRALHEGKVIGVDFSSNIISRDGKRLPVDHSAAPVKDADGNVQGAVMVLRNVQDRLAAEEKLKQSEEYFRNLFDLAPVGMALVGLDYHFLKVNSAICTLLGYSKSELLGRDQSDVSYEDDQLAERAVLDEVLGGQSLSSQFEKRYRTKDGKIVWALVNVSLLKQHDKPLCYLWQIHDLTERKEVEYRLVRLAHLDPLTGLGNRAWLNDEIERQIQIASRHHQRLAVVFADLDKFKQVNDSLGHAAGDELLQAIAQKMKSSTREIDAVARLGGDEFVMLLPEIRSAENVLVVTERFRAECTRPFLIANHEVSVGLSLGVSLYPDDAQDADTLLRFADSALYHAKAKGRNNLQFYRSELMANVQQRMSLQAELRDALERRELVLHFQPIMSLADGKPMMVEALIRWQHPTRGLLMPDAFMPLVEEMGLSSAIGAWIIEESCRTAKAWQLGAKKSIVASVNASPKQFKSGDLVDHVKRALMETGFPPEQLCLEITEQALLANGETIYATIAQLKELGVRIAIDDFGVGYSSLNHIRHITPSEIKIDRSLVRDITPEHHDSAMIKATIAMAHSMDMRVVTKGVETFDQQSFLQDEGCDMAQGYFYAPPYPAVEFRDWLARNR